MTVSENRSIIIVGAGPLMSKSLALWLASLGWNIALISRSENSLSKLTEEVIQAQKNKSAKVVYRVADAGDSASLKGALDWSYQQLDGKVDVLNYNAARVVPTDIITLTPEELESDFRISAVGTLVAGQWLTEHASAEKVKDGELPLFLVTGGVLDTNPEPMVASLSAVKSSSQTLSRIFARTLLEKFNILVGMPLVKASVVGQGSDGYDPQYDPDNIVQKLFKPFFEERELRADGKREWIVERVL